ncbi:MULTISPECIES: glycine betaine ABC transporter substrate-binding protein [Microbacterium]|uniref:glycine betaine ABC transporter substrate-binding protein n=1 Tax=Microbacterium TaxID=33882 RepID=UPI000D647196|nr:MULTISPECIES: glycine betaine ABC transporter substrate-binding protein [Microbacterium]
MNRQLIRIVAVAATALLSVGIAGCASGGSGGEQTSGEDKEVNFAIIPGWNDNLDLAHLYKYVLERNGYTFDITELSEIATVYTAAARGDVDVFSSAPTSIHKVYWDEFKDDLEDLGAYYQNGAIFIAVPDYVSDVTSIEDLPAHAAEFDGTIFGIEPGSGLATTTQDVVFPAYGLGDTFEQKTSSTAAMLAELQKAVDEEKPVAVTIWNPWWVNSVFPMRRLEDPKKAYGEDYTINTVANAEFSKKSPKAAEMMSSLKLDDDEFNTLDDAIYNQFEPGEEQEAVAAWFEDHPDLLEELESYLKN